MPHTEREMTACAALTLFAGVGGTVTFTVVDGVLGVVGAIDGKMMTIRDLKYNAQISQSETLPAVLNEPKWADREAFRQLVVLQQAREQLVTVSFPQDIPHDTLHMIE